MTIPKPRQIGIAALAACLLALAACGTPSSSADSLHNKGVDRMERGNCAAAINYFKMSLVLKPGQYDSHTNLGYCYRVIGEYELALEESNRAIQINPNRPQAYANRGLVYQQIGDAERAVSDWERQGKLMGSKQIEYWQKLLTAEGHYAGTVDGIFTKEVRDALLLCAADLKCFY